MSGQLLLLFLLSSATICFLSLLCRRLSSQWLIYRDKYAVLCSAEGLFTLATLHCLLRPTNLPYRSSMLINQTRSKDSTLAPFIFVQNKKWNKSQTTYGFCETRCVVRIDMRSVFVVKKCCLGTDTPDGHICWLTVSEMLLAHARSFEPAGNIWQFPCASDAPSQHAVVFISVTI